MKSSDLNKLLVKEFPELSSKYNEEIDWQEGHDTGSHVIFGDVFVPYINECMLKKENCKILKIFNFIEKLLKINDIYIEEVIAFSVLEGLFYDTEALKYCMDYVGTNTKKVLVEVGVDII